MNRGKLIITLVLEKTGHTNYPKAQNEAVLILDLHTVPSSLILFTLMMEAICSSETSVLIRAIWHHITDNGHSLQINPFYRQRKR
jgi:hypothetical protein